MGRVAMDEYIGYGMDDREREVLGRFFRGRTLEKIPAARSKRLIVLERLALEFEVGRRYPEASVNEILLAFHRDVAALRRHLVDEGLLDRDHGEYWRSGGRTDDLADVTAKPVIADPVIADPEASQPTRRS